MKSLFRHIINGFVKNLSIMGCRDPEVDKIINRSDEQPLMDDMEQTGEDFRVSISNVYNNTHFDNKKEKTQ